MDMPLILLTMIILTAIGVYVLMQDWRAATNRLFALFALSAIVLMGAAVTRLTGKRHEDVWFALGLTGPSLAVGSLLLAWLILATFIPHRYAQKSVRWILAAPYLIMTLFLAVDWYGGFSLVRRIEEIEEGRRIIVAQGPLFVPVIALYVFGGMLAPTGMLLAASWRNRAMFRAAIWLSGGLALSFIVGAVSGERSSPALSYISMLPLYLAFGWVILRYQMFRPSSVALRTAVEHLPDGVVVLDAQRRVRFANRAAQHLAPFAGASVSFEESLAHAGFYEQTTPDDQLAGLRRFHRNDAVAATIIVSEAAIEGDRGSAWVALIRDVTTAERQKAALAASRAALEARTAELERSLKEIQQRDALITRLTLPLIPLSDGVLAMPLIGAFDGTRCETLITLLLKQIEERGARTVLLDLTGITGFDESLARALRHAVDGARLMGAQIALCGVRPDIAESIVHERMHLNGVRLFATMQEGVAAALRQR